MISENIKLAVFVLVMAGFFLYCIIPEKRMWPELPFRLLLLAIMLVLFIAQNTFFCRFPMWGVRLEFLPPLILFIALTTDFSMTIVACVFASLLYDMMSPVRLGTSLLPYVLGGSVFCVIKPMLFRNSWLTRFVSGWTISMIIIFFQWIAFRATGHADLPFWHVVVTTFKLSLFGGLLSIAYFALIDLCARMLDLLPPQKGDIDYGRDR